MYTVPKSNNELLVKDQGKVDDKAADGVSHKERIKRELRALGVTKHALRRGGGRYLPSMIHPDEHIGGVVYGRRDSSFVVLVATDRRIIFLDKQPLFINEDEITYFVVSGVSYSHAGIGSTITLHTRIKDYPIRTLNQKCATGFMRYVEQRCLEHKSQKEESHDNPEQSWAV